VNILRQKCFSYVANGVRIAILIEPGGHTAGVFRPQSTPSVLGSGDRIDVDDVLPGLGLTVDEVFGWLRRDIS
jgi:Uma2 family endonuclease